MSKARIYYARVDEFWRKGQKYDYLEEKGHVGGVEWQELHPDVRNTWVTEGLRTDFDLFLPLGTKEAKQGRGGNEVVFIMFSLGVNTARDSVVYDFDPNQLADKVRRFCEAYNLEILRYRQNNKPKDVDNFLNYETVKWSEHLKGELRRGMISTFDPTKINGALYRPFTKNFLYYDAVLNDRPGLFRTIFPTPSTDNQVICLAGVGDRKGFGCLLADRFPSLDLAFEKVQCFPFYIYDEDGTNRRENVTDWALEKFRAQYADESISKWDIFHYVYALLHHPAYRERYAANLKRELPRVPFAPDFRAFAAAGARLADLHVNYERQPEYPLERAEQPGAALDWRVERMKLGKDKRTLVYNDFLTLSGIPPEAFEYRLGNRSALEWIVDQYQVSTDRRSGITNDPNRPDDPQYVVRLVGQVTHVSVETVNIVRALPGIGLEAHAS